MKKYALIDWIHHHNSSIILARGVRDARMFEDTSLVGSQLYR
jgi:hypothetical protein